MSIPANEDGTKYWAIFLRLPFWLRTMIVLLTLDAVILGLYLWLGPIRTLQQTNETLTGDPSALRGNVTTLTDKKDELHRENLPLKEALDAAEKEVKMLQQTGSSLKTDLSLSQAKVITLNDRNNELHRENLHLKDLMSPIEEIVGKLYPSLQFEAAIEKLKEDASKLCAKIEEMEREAAPRSISKEQRDQFISLLKTAPKGSVSVYSFVSAGAETIQYANQIRDMLVAAGYDSGEMVGMKEGEIPIGSGIGSKRAAASPAHTGAVYVAFSKIGVHLKPFIHPTLKDANEVQIIVGLKPSEGNP